MSVPKLPLNKEEWDKDDKPSVNPLEVIILKMCEYAEVKPEEADLKKTTWTKSQMKKFYEWMLEWLLHSPDVREKVINKPLTVSVTLKERKKYTQNYLLKYGFKIEKKTKLYNKDGKEI